jgi:DNA polymerase III alpha subunit
MPDIDIDFTDRDQALRLFDHTVASRLEENKLVKHNTGVYLHEVELDPISGLCNIPYNIAEEQGYFKIDFLNVGLYKGVRDEAHLIQLMETEPLWDLLEQDEFTQNLFHVNGHGSILRQSRPKSIDQLAAVLAMIRPAKRYLIGKDWTTIMTEIWTKPENDEYFFKKSHAIAYATAIVVQMNLICEQVSYEFS